MGCDFCVYVPATEDKDCGMAYSTFGRVRTSIIALYLEKMGKVVDLSDGEDFNLMMNVVSQSLVDKVSKALDELKTEEADAMKVLWEHSDCDGSYWTEDCENIAKGIKKILPMFDKDDDDKDWAKSLMEMFEYAGRNEGIVEVC